MRAVLFAVALGVLATPAAAQTDEQKADARAAAEQGATAFQSGNYAEAADLFIRAESLYHAPPHLLFLARAQVKLGQLVKARENYRKVARESLAANAPAAFVNAQTDAKKELAELEPRIPMLKVVVKGAEGKQVTVTVDGAAIPAQMIAVLEPFMGSPTLLMIAIMVLVMVVGTAMDMTPTILILTPVLMPVVKAAGIDPVYFGVLFVMNNAIGLVTPPVGTVLNTVAGVGRMKMDEVTVGVIPFMIAEFGVMFLLVFAPWLVTGPARWLAG